MTYLADRQRHLVCSPFSVDGLHSMARELGIGRHWYHATRGHEHYDIPKRQIARVLADPRVAVVSPRQIVVVQSAHGHPTTDRGPDTTALAVRLARPARRAHRSHA